MVQGAASLCVLADAIGMLRASEASGYLTHLAATALIEGSGLVSAMPWATWRVPPPSAVVLAVYYLTVVAWLLASQPAIDSASRRRVARVSASGALVLWGWIAAAPLSWLPPPPGGPLRITAVDVGQGDAFLVTAPDRQTLMVDAGGIPVGAFDIGDRIVGPALRARGLRRLDYVALTHADLDHLGGAAALLRDFAPREVWAGVPVAGHAPLEALRGLARATRTPWRWLQRGDRLEMGRVEVIAHHPPMPDWERQRVRNDDSLVLEVRYGAVSVWLTGDISEAVERELLAAADHRRLNVLKAAHHGSLTSSGRRWVEHLRPAAVLVSAGRGNLFGHPAPAVVARYKSVGAEVFRTDKDGQIELVTNGLSLEVSTFSGRKWRLKR
jgi:competence protein ComEC